MFSTGGNKHSLTNDEHPRYGELLSLQQSAIKRKERFGKFNPNKKFYESDDWETEAGYIHPMIECRLVL